MLQRGQQARAVREKVRTGETTGEASKKELMQAVIDLRKETVSFIRKWLDYEKLASPRKN